MQRIGLAETIEAVRGELEAAIAADAESAFHFPVERVELEFHVVVERSTDGKAGMRFWVVEVGGSAAYRNEQVQTVRVTLGAPVDDQGSIIKVMRGTDDKP